MPVKPGLIASDLEGVYIPEVWIGVSEKTGIPDLRLTTRDIKDYDELMQMRMATLKKHNLGIKEIQEVISTMDPLPGAKEFLDEMRSRYQFIVLSDTFYEFAHPFMKKLEFPTLFCHTLEIDENGTIQDYHLRIPDGKRQSVIRFKELGFKVIAMGDSYNDTAMIGEGDVGILFNAPQNVKDDFPDFQSTDTFPELNKIIHRELNAA
jgi:phosphoserine/homoserine phosphotransferase